MLGDFWPDFQLFVADVFVIGRPFDTLCGVMLADFPSIHSFYTFTTRDTMISAKVTKYVLCPLWFGLANFVVSPFIILLKPPPKAVVMSESFTSTCSEVHLCLAKQKLEFTLLNITFYSLPNRLWRFFEATASGGGNSLLLAIFQKGKNSWKISVWITFCVAKYW